MAAGSEKAVVAAMAANASIAVAKFFGFFMTGAASMLAEGVHSVADSGNQALLLWGGRAARREPDERRPFGYGRERYFWAFVVALILFTLGGVYAMYEGIEKLLHPHAIEQAGWAIGILAVGVVLETGSFLIAFKESKKVKGQASWWDFIRLTKSPELPTVLLEDIGALLGLVFALIGVTLAATTGEARFDAMGSIAIGVLLIAIAVILAIEMRSLLIGEAAAAGVDTRIISLVKQSPQVEQVFALRTQHLGPDDLLIGIKAEFPDSMTFSEIAREIDAIEARLREELPAARFIYVEPACAKPKT